MTENFALQALITQSEVVPRYWSQNDPSYEVDFLIQRENDMFPAEVRSEADTTSRNGNKNTDPRGITEQLKAENRLEWVQRVNNVRVRAMEIVNEEIICA